MFNKQEMVRFLQREYLKYKKTKKNMEEPKYLIFYQFLYKNKTIENYVEFFNCIRELANTIDGLEAAIRHHGFWKTNTNYTEHSLILDVKDIYKSESIAILCKSFIQEDIVYH